MVLSNKILLFLALLGRFYSSFARNLAITADGIAIGTLTNGARGLVTYDTDTGVETLHNFPQLANIVVGFDDVAVDPSSLAKSSDEPTFVFALSANRGRVCSFEMQGQQPTNEVSISPIGCTTTSVFASPFVGVSAMGGTLIVSGGTGGASVFTYNIETGVISDPPIIRNQRFSDVGYPDVTLVTPTLAAMSTDLRQGFGVAMLEIGRNTMQRVRQFPIVNTLRFAYTISPCNFPLVSSVYNEDGGDTYLYVANGPMTVQNPLVDGIPVVISGAPDGFTADFEAVTVDVNSAERIVVFGGVAFGGALSGIVIFDVTNPLSPIFIGQDILRESLSDGGGRITSVATHGDDIVYVRQGVDGVGHSWSLQKALAERDGTSVPVEEPNETTNSSDKFGDASVEEDNTMMETNTATAGGIKASLIGVLLLAVHVCSFLWSTLDDN
uniref:Uncharacterized protein n=1 Tax=Minutocellus polymorphus TaxID=265543 RepID=A0A7S0AH39_9STRA|mmetsp:Transcript_13833/g.22993  ORF Transcript_13833/g.22993 Transcript_13833/m.22993 type:complete len:440 (+) Transcript_13833:131-1450(+)